MESPTLQASSAVRKSGFSTTLPRNFAPLSLDVNEPRTPDQTFAEISLPPPPPHSTYRIRRSKFNMEPFTARENILAANLFASEIPAPSSPRRGRLNYSTSVTSHTFSSDEPLPSIETPVAQRPGLFRGVSEPMALTSSLQVPAPYHLPQTPPAQTGATSHLLKSSKWDMQRAASVCSARSASSVDSEDTMATRPTSFDGSATSPDCDNSDPFSPQLVKIIPDTPTRKSKKMKIRGGLTKNNMDWSIEMDNHLFNVYQMYLADPTVTPFKTVPGSIPPTGVCHRVARRARETWPRASRIEVPIIRRYKVRSLLDVRKTIRDTTPELNDFLKTDEFTNSDHRNTWPSESSTRKRLKQLCRQKFTISAHYQRLRESRSPSPFSDQFTHRPNSRLSRSVSRGPENDQTTSYTTRELGISLVASDATAPLARLVAEDTPMPSEPDKWFNTPISNDAMHITPSLVPPAIVEPERLAPIAANIPRLASPFNYSTWNGAGSKNPHRRHISHGQYDTIHATGTRLLSPFQPDADSIAKINKRRAQRDLEDELSPRGSNLSLASSAMHLDGSLDIPPFQPKVDIDQDVVFSGHGDINQRRIRVRNRGATLGSAMPVFSATDRLERFFNQNPQSSDIPEVPAIPAAFAGGQSTHPANPISSLKLQIPNLDMDASRRLGSPFELDPNKRSFRSRSPRHVPSLSDPFISTDHFGINSATSVTSGPPFSSISTATTDSIGTIGERLALFSATTPQHDRAQDDVFNQ